MNEIHYQMTLFVVLVIIVLLKSLSFLNILDYTFLRGLHFKGSSINYVTLLRWVGGLAFCYITLHRVGVGQRYHYITYKNFLNSIFIILYCLFITFICHAHINLDTIILVISIESIQTINLFSCIVK